MHLVLSESKPDISSMDFGLGSASSPEEADLWTAVACHRFCHCNSPVKAG
jgi:hypothetical protein